MDNLRMHSKQAELPLNDSETNTIFTSGSTLTKQNKKKRKSAPKTGSNTSVMEIRRAMATSATVDRKGNARERETHEHVDRTAFIGGAIVHAWQSSRRRRNAALLTDEEDIEGHSFESPLASERTVPRFSPPLLRPRIPCAIRKIEDGGGGHGSFPFVSQSDGSRSMKKSALVSLPSDPYLRRKLLIPHLNDSEKYVDDCIDDVDIWRTQKLTLLPSLTRMHYL